MNFLTDIPNYRYFTEADEELTEDDLPEVPKDDDEEQEEDIEELPEVPKEEDENHPEEISDEEPSEEDLPEIPKEEPEESQTEEPPKEEEPKKESFPKQIDAEEKDKNGVRRKKLYIAFIEWAKKFNPKNTFGSVFDKDVFHVTYPFVPHDMRYFYRLANPILCVLAGHLTFFQLSELKKLNAQNNKLADMMIFAATDKDIRVFSNKDLKVYMATLEGNEIKLGRVLGNTFDTYIQSMIKQGDILNGPEEDNPEESAS